MKQQTNSRYTVDSRPELHTVDSRPQYIEVIRNRNKGGKIECIVTGMSDEDIDIYLLSHPETYLSMAQYDEQKGITL